MSKNEKSVKKMKRFAVIKEDRRLVAEFIVAENVPEGRFVRDLNKETMNRVIGSFHHGLEDEECRGLCERFRTGSAFEVLFRTDSESVAYGVKARYEKMSAEILAEVRRLSRKLDGYNEDMGKGFSEKGGNVGKFLVYLPNGEFYKLFDDEWGNGYGKIECESKDFFILEGNRAIDKNQRFYLQKIVGTEKEAEKYNFAIDGIIEGYGEGFESLFGEHFNEEMGNAIEEAVAQPA